MIETRPSLIFRIRDASDNESWTEFMRLYRPFLCKFVRAKGLDENDAEDIVQEVFVRLWKAPTRSQWDPAKGKFRTWLWAVVNHAVADHFRRRRRYDEHEIQWQAEIEAAEVAAAGPPERGYFEAERDRVIEFALAEVRKKSNPTTWQCFEKRVLQQRPAEEIADELGCSQEMVYHHASRTLKKVRAKCREYMEGWTDE